MPKLHRFMVDEPRFGDGIGRKKSAIEYDKEMPLREVQSPEAAKAVRTRKTRERKRYSQALKESAESQSGKRNPIQRAITSEQTPTADKPRNTNRKRSGDVVKRLVQP